jgi:hypothetical protein
MISYTYTPGDTITDLLQGDHPDRDRFRRSYCQLIELGSRVDRAMTDEYHHSIRTMRIGR